MRLRLGGFYPVRMIMAMMLFFGAAPVGVAEELSHSVQAILNPLTLSPSLLTIESASGKQHRFSVEVADNDEVRAQGLMFRSVLPPDHGMLFDFMLERPVAMWMKNTLIPLDMLFIRADGIIHRIEQRTEPYSLRSIYSAGRVKAVLELAGGVTEDLGIRAGDQVRHPIFEPH